MIPIAYEKGLEALIDEGILEQYAWRLLGPTVSRHGQQLRDARRRCLELMEPRAIYRALKIEGLEQERVRLERGISFEASHLARILRGSRIAYLFVITLGHPLDSEMNRIRGERDGLLDAVLLEAASTVALWELRSRLRTQIIEKELDPIGWSLTCGYAPGQYRWPLEQQRTLFSIVEAEKIGITLTDSALMIPLKSLSGAFGAGPAESINKTDSACSLCDRRECPARQPVC